MKQFNLFNRLFFSALLFTVFAFAATSCQKEDAPFEAEAPEVNAALSGYGSCGSCPLPASMDGPLPSHLYSSSAWNTSLSTCFEEDLADVGARCQFRPGAQNILTEDVSLYLQFSTHPATSNASLCSHFYQVGNALSYARPSGNWLLESVNYMSHLTGSNYKINVTWRRYICEHQHVVKVK